MEKAPCYCIGLVLCNSLDLRGPYSGSLLLEFATPSMSTGASEGMAWPTEMLDWGN